MGISRDSAHKRRLTGGRLKPMRKKRKFEMGRQPANTKIGEKVVRRVRCRGGNFKFRALRLDSGNFTWPGEAVARKTRILKVVYNATSNELVRTNTVVKSCIVQIDATPFKTWYQKWYNVQLGKKTEDIQAAKAAAQEESGKGKKVADKKPADKKAGDKKPTDKKAGDKTKTGTKKPVKKSDKPDQPKGIIKPRDLSLRQYKQDQKEFKAKESDAAKAKRKADKAALKTKDQKAPADAKKGGKGAKAAPVPKNVAAKKEAEDAAKATDKTKPVHLAPKEADPNSKSFKKRIALRNKKRVLEPALEDQFKTGRLYARITSRPGQVGRADGIVLEGEELAFYIRKLHAKKRK